MNKRIQFHALEISDVRRETADAISIAFHIPDDIKDKYKYQAGQYLTLRATVNGEDLRRPYSICTAPNDNEVRVCIKQVEQGRFSTYANQNLAKGDIIEVMTPLGHFVHTPNPDASNHFVGIAGGSGITPILAILRSVLSEDPEAIFTLFYGNRTAASMIFRKQFSDLKNQYMSRLNICHVLSDEEMGSDLMSGIMDSAKTEKLIGSFTNPSQINHFYICGPGPMMDGAEAALKRLGVDKDLISVERFIAAPAPSNKFIDKAFKNNENIAADAVAAEVTIIVDGETRVVKMSSEDSVLDVGLLALMDLPHACKGGVCCTCRAKLVAGKVSMAVTTGLEPYEIEAGFILTCQAKPLTDKLIVDYDAQ
ncbi:MAG: phenylacetate-CoA oxygenase/reductase subunit PaaK [Rhizobiales bacterium]|nr:phenylacetate-CoA oxygenase/reductase subunit PaaK [Hyphomicrobiales bacterium]